MDFFNYSCMNFCWSVVLFVCFAAMQLQPVTRCVPQGPTKQTKDQGSISLTNFHPVDKTEELSISLQLFVAGN